MQTVRRVIVVCAALVLIALAAFVVSLMSGSVEMSLAELWHGLRSSDALSHTLVFELRLPRTLTAFAAGGVLALAGVLMQVLLRNPLADPFIMGVSGGAAVATRRFEAKEPADGSASSVAPAINAAANRVAMEVAQWVGAS